MLPDSILGLSGNRCLCEFLIRTTVTYTELFVYWLSEIAGALRRVPLGAHLTLLQWPLSQKIIFVHLKSDDELEHVTSPTASTLHIVCNTTADQGGFRRRYWAEDLLVERNPVRPHIESTKLDMYVWSIGV